MAIPEFHQWLEKKVEELRRNTWVQTHAYNLNSPPLPYSSDVFIRNARCVDGVWCYPCFRCEKLCKVTTISPYFVRAHHICDACSIQEPGE